MFQSEHISITDWLLFFVLMAIPGLNVIILVILLLNPKTNKSIKNFLLALVIIAGLIFFGYLAVLGIIVSQF